MSVSRCEHRLDLACPSCGATNPPGNKFYPDTIRGRAYALVVVDEAAQVRELDRAWEQVLRPNADRLSGARVVPLNPEIAQLLLHALSAGPGPRRQ